MKKASLIACACALFMGAQTLAAQEVVEEVAFVSDPAQGVLLNRMQDNWFITAEGGAGVYFSTYAKDRKFMDRFRPAASIYVGKWFTPVFGARVGINWTGLKGLAAGADYFGTYGARYDKYYKTKFNEFGPVADFMVNLTNWWCGYKPNRVYNATLYGGAGMYLTYTPNSKGDWKKIDNSIMALRGGLINSFRLSEQVALSLDIRATLLDGLQNKGGKNWNQKYGVLQAFLGLTYNFKDRQWNAPIVPVFPEPENCDALRARLAAADARIADLEKQLKDCLSRPVETIVENNGPLCTVYYPIGVSRLSRENQRVIKAIANVMTQNPSKKYIVTGWADNYTGTDNINKRLRKNRADGVAKVLYKNGVPESQITVTTNNGNLNDLGEKCVALDRCVTIDLAK